MNEADVRRQVNRSLGEYGYYYLTQTVAKGSPFSGRPDAILLHPTRVSAVVEYKVLKLEHNKSFAFNEINPKQRKWQDRWLNLDGKGYIGLGIIDKTGKVDSLLTVYLVDWYRWLEVEKAVTPIQASIPHLYGKGMKKALRVESITYDIASQFMQSRMYKSDGKWTLPPYHSAIP
ncbi:hypothetical protein LCGC14_1133040 [marine sediment metagenome]|uniref:Uncharacterized protein n=1 Tax=marine sediment metagenome TaxID=412755 RepID=A0A0F9PIU9_9ZZZZ